MAEYLPRFQRIIVNYVDPANDITTMCSMLGKEEIVIIKPRVAHGGISSIIMNEGYMK